MRQPLEDGVVTISRAKAALTFPARFTLVASQNPCPCGYYGDVQKECTCSPMQRQRYKERISGPLLDRIDLRITVPRLPPDDLLKTPTSESSESIRARVCAARDLAMKRQNTPNAYLMGQALRKHVALTSAAESFAQLVSKQLALSGRGFDRLLRVARTIADLEVVMTSNGSSVTDAHLAEAVSYRDNS
jgi:magnesium chelatase family protein